jgi:hypothetical protein
MKQYYIFTSNPINDSGFKFRILKTGNHFNFAILHERHGGRDILYYFKNWTFYFKVSNKTMNSILKFINSLGLEFYSFFEKQGIKCEFEIYNYILREFILKTEK